MCFKRIPNSQVFGIFKYLPFEQHSSYEQNYTYLHFNLQYENNA